MRTARAFTALRFVQDDSGALRKDDNRRVILSGAVGEAIYETWNFSSLVELSPLG